ncbi:hypothetical protein EMIT0194MI4_120051 [Pseudomonas sp. IT-194MI4]
MDLLLPRAETGAGLVGRSGGQAQRGAGGGARRNPAGRKTRPAPMGRNRPDYGRCRHAGAAALGILPTEAVHSSYRLTLTGLIALTEAEHNLSGKSPKHSAASQ